MVDEDWVVSDRPAESLEAERIALTRARPHDREALIKAINESLDHLRPWMPWAQTTASVTSVANDLNQAWSDWLHGRAFQYVIRPLDDQLIIGGCGLSARIGPSALEIGYWVHADHTHQGVATAATRLLTDAGLALTSVQRTEIHCDEANPASAAVPVRLGYRLDRIAESGPTAPAETGRSMIWAYEADPATH